jgi:hypothetical protein
MVYVVVTLDNQYMAVFSSEIAARDYIKSTDAWLVDGLRIIYERI